VHWLDTPSEGALGFVVRRFEEDRIGVFCARRELNAVPLGLDRALPAGRLERLALTGLDTGELGAVLRGALGTPIARPTVARIRRASGGNLYFALEIGRALSERGQRLDPADELPIPASLQEIVRGRLAALPAPAREAAQVAAALARPTVGVVDAALSGGACAEAAVAAGVLERSGERLSFAHPLLATVAYQLLADSDRRALHARLAELLEDPEERARHLAAAAAGSDEMVAAALAEAARRAAARGAPDAAAELLERARTLTPDDDPERRGRRGVEAAERQFEAGDVAHARTLLEAVIAESPAGGLRAHALARLGWVCIHQEGIRSGSDVFFAALAEPTDDVRLRIEILEGLAWCLHSSRGVPAALEHACAALALAEELGEPTVLAEALALTAFLESVGGEGLALAMIERAVALDHSPAWLQVLGRPDWLHALLLGWSGALESARDRFDALRREAIDGGDEHSLPFLLFPLGRLELLTGDWKSAARHARECTETSDRNGQVGERPYSLALQALVAAHRGEVETAHGHITEGIELADRLGVVPGGIELLAARGFLELSLADHAAAERTLDEVALAATSMGLLDPALFRYHGDRIEAKIALGHREEAAVLLAELEQLGARLRRPWPQAIAARCRGLLSAALGDSPAADAALAEALILSEALAEPLEHARTLLVLGTVQRRERKKRPARESLEAALTIFETLGAALWSERTRGELARIGGRAATAELTPTEARVAELLAAGSTYQQAADALFVSPKTVQWNVSKIYRKLGIASRAELVKHLDDSR
jgi:DNA-binding CsgD family transcriptional regulator